jgi:hypothetical protein
LRLEHSDDQNIPELEGFSWASSVWVISARVRRIARAAGRTEHDNYVIQMNEVHRSASAWVQRGTSKVTTMIDEPGHSTGHL